MRSLHNMGVYKALLLAGCAGTITLAMPASAQVVDCDVDPDNPDCAVSGDAIIVTGSRIQRQDFNSTSPTITADEALLDNSSTTAVESNLNKLPQFVPAQTPTLGGDIQPTATNTPGAATVSLRGIGSNRTLVLVDGRRSTPANASGVTDVSTIPAAAIERVEVISGGASATYGADAVAGVTNFILKKNVQGLELDAQMGITEQGDSFEYQLSGIMGTDFADGRGNISLALSMNTREGSYQRDRKWYRDIWADPQIGGSQFFIDRPGVILGFGNAINPAVFESFFPDSANAQGATYADTDNNPATPNVAVCTPAPNNSAAPIDSGACFPVGITQDVFAINVLGGAQGFNVWTNPDGSLFTGTGFAQRGGVQYFDGVGQNGYKVTAAGTLAKNNENLYLILPLTRYNALARGNYEINDWIGVFGQANFSAVTTYTRNEPGPITNGWDVFLPYGTGTYVGSARGQATNGQVLGTGNLSSVILNGMPTSGGGTGTPYVDPTPNDLTDNPTNPAFTAIYRDQFACALNPTGGCTNNQVIGQFLPQDLQTLLNARTNPNAPVQLTTLMPQDRETFTDVMTYNMTAGLQGSVPDTDWTWEAFVNHGESHTFARQTGIYSLERTQTVLSSPGLGAGFRVTGNPESNNFGASTGTCTSGLNFFNPPAGGYSQDCLEAISADLKNRSKFRQTIAEFNAQGGIFDLPAGQLRGAIGASYREMDYEFINDTLTTQGRSFLDQALGIYPSGDAFGEINVKEVYGELLIPVLADIPFIQEFNLEVGGRMSNYDTTGTSWTYKVLGDWTVTDWLRLRGGYNRAERAPNIGELFLAAQQTFGVNNRGDVCSRNNPNAFSANPGAPTNPNNGPGNAGGAAGAADVEAVCRALMNQADPAAANQYYSGTQATGSFGFAFPTLIGNPNLSPEKADTWTAGIVVQSPFDSGALSRLRLSVDWYDITVKDAIGAQTVGVVQQQCYDTTFNTAVSGAAGPDGVAGTSDDNAAAAAANPFCQFVPRNGTGQLGNVNITYTNDGRVHLSGIDAQVDWGIDVGPGTFTLNSALNYQMDFESSALYPSLPLIDYVGTTGPGENGLNPNVFEWRAFTTVGYSWGPARIALQWQYYSGLEDGGEATVPGGTPDQVGWPSYNLFALNASYQVTDDVGLRFGIDNLFNKRPPVGNYNRTIDDDVSAVTGLLRGGSFLGVHDTQGRRFFLGANARF